MLDPLDTSRIIAETGVNHVEYRPTVGSTNDVARELAATMPRDSLLLVIADEQTAGRGRGANRWWTGPGALAFSLLVDTASRPVAKEHSGMIALAAAMAVVETIDTRLEHHPVGLHWPNDVFVGDRKIAGVLVETLADGRHVVGIGCNVNNTVEHAPEELAAIVTTLRDLTTLEHDRTGVLVDLIGHFERRLDQLGTAPLELGQECDRRCLQHGRTLTIEIGGMRTTGVCAGIAEDGSLLLDTAEGPRRFYSGVLIKQLPKF
ncbi:MAG: biotin--[acetyl-CoA-carboxylase] ligase [Planctomycetaceae bacterium]|nr:biotin--[acetyl-CoA-carboxylase] ligase [Planctomycetaceae bacterium]